MSEAEKSNGVISRVTSGTGRFAKRAGKAWAYTMFGDVSGELNRKRELYAWFRSKLTLTPGREETFDQALKRLRVTAEQLAEREASLARMQAVYGGTAAVAFVILLLSPMVERPLTQFIMAAGVLGMCVVKTMVCRFRLFEIRQRRFVSFVDWVMGRA